MAVPTQALPSWMTLTTATFTQTNGAITTALETLTLPLTYYGPSIPLGTDGEWTWGGLTPPVSSSSPSATATISTSPSSATLTPSTRSSPTASSASSLSSATSPSSSTATLSASSSSSVSPASTRSASSSMSPSLTSSSVCSASSSGAGALVGKSHGVSASVLGAILGAILGTLLLVVILLIVLLLRRHHRGERQSRDDSLSKPSSSFWNRQTTLASQQARPTPIWTEWQMVHQDDLEDGSAGEHSPGERSPRPSGEENDPFLTRRSYQPDADTGDMTQSKMGPETLVSVPAAAAVAGTMRDGSGRKFGGHIMPRDELIAKMSEDSASGSLTPTPYVRVLQPSPGGHNAPLVPPPSRGLRPGAAKSAQSFGSQVLSEKSQGTLGDEGTESLPAQRIKVGDAAQAEAGPSSWTRPSGLERLTNLPNFSWFNRFGTRSRSTSPTGDTDTYTRSPPRVRSRPVSWAPLPTSEPGSNEASTNSRRPRPSSLLGLGLGLTDARPISSISTRSRISANSGNSAFQSARETPASSTPDVYTPMSTLASAASGARSESTVPLQRPRATSPASSAEPPRLVTNRGYLSVPGEPPAYEELPFSQSAESAPAQPRQDSGIDVLDIPAPRPASPFSAVAGRPEVPPGLTPLPDPRAWRDSHITEGSGSSSSMIHIDVLEDAPPIPQDGWRSLSGSIGEGRRTTFGMPTLIHPRNALTSEAGSLHSMRSHLSPRSNFNSSGSAPASSLHTHNSSSSRPSAHSHAGTGSSGVVSLAHSNSISEDGRRQRRRVEVGEVSPPVSAVFSREGMWDMRGTSPLSQSLLPPLPPIHQASSSSSGSYPSFPEPVMVGTVTSATTTKTNMTNTNSSVTTALTDPITGTTVHLPALPMQQGRNQAYVGAAQDDDTMW
ncbi:hypothetical protein WOLCODRAFT_163904 [Wolfiporia cocos MD-104 SS10]|uniref:Uncharacterized protein n=1 Tax=Wolfiporia cocos (strain MD-104) TaxID=742152 RepID=A0A2H3JRR1_WOLCO|nr:hypothetical protein WOLCODRAFT_163904 [Wolfiporia cocos MD-104 SS10]